MSPKLLPRLSLALALSLSLSAPAVAENVDHPAYRSWSKHPVGTTIVVRSRTEGKVRTLTTTTTSTLQAIKPDQVTLDVVRESDATDSLIKSPPETQSIFRVFPLLGKTKKEDVGKPTDAIEKGEETLKVSGKEYRTVWYDTKGKGEGGLGWTTRVWLSEEVPGRLVKSVTRFPDAGTTTTVEVIELKAPEGPKSAK
ncbi:hypothetical protein [Aquisphaera insulae]|uniref:hypothetical protein n=1 Tax=Aquisphaera insulae TaxID=2712864 RepID=UPI0013EAFF8D|nr:hypothetical protein [Aquisphaera insulae]